MGEYVAVSECRQIVTLGCAWRVVGAPVCADQSERKLLPPLLMQRPARMDAVIIGFVVVCTVKYPKLHRDEGKLGIELVLRTCLEHEKSSKSGTTEHWSGGHDWSKAG